MPKTPWIKHRHYTHSFKGGHANAGSEISDYTVGAACVSQSDVLTWSSINSYERQTDRHRWRQNWIVVVLILHEIVGNQTPVTFNAVNLDMINTQVLSWHGTQPRLRFQEMSRHRMSGSLSGPHHNLFCIILLQRWSVSHQLSSCTWARGKNRRFLCHFRWRWPKGQNFWWSGGWLNQFLGIKSVQWSLQSGAP